MITSVENAKKIACVRDDQKQCQSIKCMAWEYWTPKTVAVEKRPDHGIPDAQKLGYCGLVNRR